MPCTVLKIDFRPLVEAGGNFLRERDPGKRGDCAARGDITSAAKDSKTANGGRNWKQQRDDVVICA